MHPNDLTSLTPPGGKFKLCTELVPRGDQPSAIEQLCEGLSDQDGRGRKFQTLLGVTGSGKTFTIAQVIARHQRPVLVMSHNKTLAAQLYEEFCLLFPQNAVEYFVSYYDYYQPEAYIPQRDIYIEKDASRNEDLDRLRMAATSSLASRGDVIIVASVSCIFSIGSPQDYKAMVLDVRRGDRLDRQELLEQLVEMQYERADVSFQRSKFRVRGDVVEVYPAYAQYAYRIELFGDQVDRIELINPLTGQIIIEQDQMALYPAKHYVMPEDRLDQALGDIQAELEQRLGQFRSEGKLLEAQRLEARVRYDMEMMREVGYCGGIENYSRHLAGLPAGRKPFSLVDHFPDDFLLIIDESHVTIPQIRAMWSADRHRKEVLVEHGFRLPSALDNRPLKFEEFQEMWHKVIFVSATPGPYELEKCQGQVTEQIIRPTGLIDPVIHIQSASGQVKHLLDQIRQRAQADERVLVTTLTKRLAEQLAHYIQQENLRGKYLHSEINTLERVEILKDLRLGKFDVLVGVNLLREGLDLPEVSLVAILDADKQGFLRSATSLIQTIGRTARNVNAEVIFYADKITPAMQQAIDETNRRRSIQKQYNIENDITPQTIRKEIRTGLEAQMTAKRITRQMACVSEEQFQKEELISLLEQEMLDAAERLEFEQAGKLRDQIKMLGRDLTGPVDQPYRPAGARSPKGPKPRSTRRKK